MSVFGIDFGSSKCVMAMIHQGQVKIITNEVSNRSTPSLVVYPSGDDSRRLIGEAAVSKLVSNSKNAIPRVKRFIGRNWNSPNVQKELSALFVKSVECPPHGTIAFEVQHGPNRRTLNAETIAAALLGQLKRTVERWIGKGVVASDCVISVPPYFNNQQRQALCDAARLTGLNVLALMNDTTAVGLQYGLLRKPQRTLICFVDIGYSDTSFSLMNIENNALEVVGTESNPNLGGLDFDNLIYEKMVADIKEKYKLDVTSIPKASMRLRKAAEKLKTQLSVNKEAFYNLECLDGDTDVNGSLTRKEFEELMAPLLEKILQPAQRLLAKTKTTIKQIQAIEMIGGAFRIPKVSETLEKFFDKQLSKTCDADESIAKGCALYGALLSPKFSVNPFKISDITPYSIEISHSEQGKSSDGCSELFGEYSVVPSLKLMTFSRNKPFELELRYSKNNFDSEDAKENTPKSLVYDTHPIIGKWCVFPEISKNIRDMDKVEKFKIKVKIRMDISGISYVSDAVLHKEYKLEKIVNLDDESAATSENTEESVPKTPPKKDGSNDNEKAANETKADVKKPKKQKRKKVKIPLRVERFWNFGMSKADFDKCYEVEATMANEDRVVSEIFAKKNELESLVYSIQDKLSFEMPQYYSDDEKAQLAPLLAKLEDWLYEEGRFTGKSKYIDRINELNKLNNPATRRLYENSNRNQAASTLQNVVNSIIEKAQQKGTWDHVPADKMKNLHDSCQATLTWLSNAMGEQAKMPLNADPKVWISDISARAKSIQQVSKDTLKPKPKPKPEPKNEKKEKEGKQEEGKEDDNMDVDKNANEDKGEEEDEFLNLD